VTLWEGSRHSVAGRLWIGGALGVGLAWSSVLYMLACVRCALPVPWLRTDAARRVGLACCTPQPHLGFTLRGAALGLGLGLALTLTQTQSQIQSQILILSLNLSLTLTLTR
jgi:hypothetical protein